MAELLYQDLSFAVVGAAMEVHSKLGQGFLEAVYRRALMHEFSLREIAAEEHPRLVVRYKDKIVGEYQADIVVDRKIILELKTVTAFDTAHVAQARNYLAATGFRLAILMNFGLESFKSKRIVL